MNEKLAVRLAASLAIGGVVAGWCAGLGALLHVRWMGLVGGIIGTISSYAYDYYTEEV